MPPTPTMGSSGGHPVVTEDRLSSLPDELLHTIMSFLKARQAVQTCVLSRRWEKLWCSMPCLDIDQQEFDVAASGDLIDHERARKSFEEFVNSLLMFHSAPSLDRLRFRVTRTYEFEVVERWFRRGIRCCPAVVEIIRAVNAIHFYGLPHLGSSSCLLKRLHLVAIYLDKNFTQHLRSGCPVLEDLKLKECLLHSPQITSCTLTNLVIIDCTTYSGNLLTITAPALISFHLAITVVGFNWAGILVNEMPSLVRASICLTYHDWVGARSLLKGPYKILCNLVNVRNLELSGSKTLSILHDGSDTFPTFSNLRTLLFDGCDLSDNFKILGCFLKNSPSLEKLALQHCKLPEASRKKERTENPKSVPLKCLDTLAFQCPKLQLTEIKYKEDDVHQLFGLLSGLWRTLRKTTIQLIKD